MSSVNPRVDIAFKKIFGVEENKDLLISLINAMLSKEDQIAEITLLNPYNAKDFKNDKLSVLDIKAKSVDGRRFNIEMQVADEADYDKRALYYWAKLYTEQLKEGNDYSKLCKAIGIHILNFTSIPQNQKYHNVFHITEKKTGMKYFENLELHTIELKKFAPDNTAEKLSDLVKKIKSSLDIWLAFLTRHDLLNKEKLPKELDDRNLRKALTALEVVNFSEEERMIYEDHLGWLRMEASALKKQEMKGRIEGIIEGERIGIEKGKIEGKIEGKTEALMSFIKNLVSEKESSERIAKLTGLSLTEVEKIRKEIK
jgi:predicted transposase/invertase (TIGR01784 family)